jgi:opacity protein-like surface antigen
MRASSTFHIAFASALLATPPAVAASRGDSGFEVGIRTGYAFSAGHLGAPPNGNDGNVSDYVSGQWPFWLDLGYRFGHSLFVGGYFQYGVGFVNDDQQSGCRNANVDCSASDVRLGAMGRYHFAAAGRLSPWIGYGFGYEWGSFSLRQSILGSSSTDSSWSGFELANFQLGADVQLPRRAVIAPFISLSLGRFETAATTTRTGSTTTTVDQDVAKKSLHEWILIGVRIAVMP